MTESLDEVDFDDKKLDRNQIDFVNESGMERKGNDNIDLGDFVNDNESRKRNR